MDNETLASIIAATRYSAEATFSPPEEVSPIMALLAQGTLMTLLTTLAIALRNHPVFEGLDVEDIVTKLGGPPSYEAKHREHMADPETGLADARLGMAAAVNRRIPEILAELAPKVH